jgi:hypothetical protein
VTVCEESSDRHEYGSLHMAISREFNIGRGRILALSDRINQALKLRSDRLLTLSKIMILMVIMAGIMLHKLARRQDHKICLLLLAATRIEDLTTNDVVIIDAIKFIQNSRETKEQ